MKVWVVASRPFEEKISGCRYYDAENEAEYRCDDLNNWLTEHNSRPVWQVYEAEFTIKAGGESRLS